MISKPKFKQALSMQCNASQCTTTTRSARFSPAISCNIFWMCLQQITLLKLNTILVWELNLLNNAVTGAGNVGVGFHYFNTIYSLCDCTNLIHELNHWFESWTMEMRKVSAFVLCDRRNKCRFTLAHIFTKNLQ